MCVNFFIFMFIISKKWFYYILMLTIIDIVCESFELKKYNID